MVREIIDASLGRHIEDADSEFERGMLCALYRSGEQRRRRGLLWLLLIAKHIARGLLFSWPLYLLAGAAWQLPKGAGLALGVLLIPAVSISGWILWRGIKEDHAVYLNGVILKPGAVGKIVTGAVY